MTIVDCVGESGGWKEGGEGGEGRGGGWSVSPKPFSVPDADDLSSEHQTLQDPKNIPKISQKYPKNIAKISQKYP